MFIHEMIMKGNDMNILIRQFFLTSFIFSATASQAGIHYWNEFKAVLSCGMNGSHTKIEACFSGTQLKLTSHGSTSVHTINNMSEAGYEYWDGLHIDLTESFSFMAQNSHDTFVLGLTIYDSNNKVVFQDVARRGGVINVGN